MPKNQSPCAREQIQFPLLGKPALADPNPRACRPSTGSSASASARFPDQRDRANDNQRGYPKRREDHCGGDADRKEQYDRTDRHSQHRRDSTDENAAYAHQQPTDRTGEDKGDRPELERQQDDRRDQENLHKRLHGGSTPQRQRKLQKSSREVRSGVGLALEATPGVPKPKLAHHPNFPPPAESVAQSVPPHDNRLRSLGLLR